MKKYFQIGILSLVVSILLFFIYQNMFNSSKLQTQVFKVISPGLLFQKTCENWGMNWYDSGKLMALASYETREIGWDKIENNFEIDIDNEKTG